MNFGTASLRIRCGLTKISTSASGKLASDADDDWAKAAAGSNSTITVTSKRRIEGVRFKCDLQSKFR
jgi:hypothetical protein